MESYFSRRYKKKQAEASGSSSSPQIVDEQPSPKVDEKKDQTQSKRWSRLHIYRDVIANIDFRSQGTGDSSELSFSRAVSIAF